MGNRWLGCGLSCLLLSYGVIAAPLEYQTQGKPQTAPLSQQLQGKFQLPQYLPTTPILTTADLEALDAMEALNKLLETEFSLFEYGLALQKARAAIGTALLDPSAVGIPPLQNALAAHTLAYDFWQTCYLKPDDFLCDENRPAVAAVLRLYAKPRMAEKIASPAEIAVKFPQPWVNTRVHVSLRETVEYIPAVEQKRVLRLLWTRALQETEKARIALGRL
ncbi:MAG: hypothetical protein RMK91_01200 [Pseudanabaenaceae cyanobacterium SKYGB_i_bin29]|nr:hypothetical protein [Pseudanabaenaceae cyanobacterium SKYG29]MDW8420465.1 hypothetical protein [Pseudanabaenaceae cyanobacterium SKYGB_i_bin29]